MANLCFGRSSLLGGGTGCAAKLLGVNVSSSNDGDAGDLPLELKTKAGAPTYRIKPVPHIVVTSSIVLL